MSHKKQINYVHRSCTTRLAFEVHFFIYDIQNRVVFGEELIFLSEYKL